MRAIVIIAVLVLAALAGLTGYAYFGDMTAAQTETRVPLTLPGQAGGAPAGD